MRHEFMNKAIQIQAFVTSFVDSRSKSVRVKWFIPICRLSQSPHQCREGVFLKLICSQF